MASISGLWNSLKLTPSLLYKNINFGGIQCQQVRTKFVNRWQIRDQKRRVCVRDLGRERMLLSTIYRCKLMPKEVRGVAHEDILALPRDSNYIRLRNRCYATSRPRGVIHEFRVSRFIFRHLADYNKLSGILRAKW